ncbi:energy-coupling factor transporter transmembrane component T family protein [Streptomyces alanosinicus]|uniref:Energy-coupling factor transporter transmembrane protein EcfT n=1 Tax=Streptomyces alanosinicus TaxID=68171 RepID=A0A918YK72_9ACTN|nr:energy-coupling factor transporter transmembrane component T [Streptomyces alanosinicus]GHE06743.1 energy-coupling factor transporter transmembrane protein EcfT [Streptomyces alanosinicus]
MDMSSHAVGDSPVHRLNPLTKLVFAVTVTVSAFAFTMIWWPPLLFCVAIVPMVIVSGTQRKFFPTFLALWVPVALTVCLMQGFFYPGAHRVVAGIGPLELKYEGLVFATQTALRVMVLMGGFFLLLLTTRPGTMMSAMTQRGMSPKTVYVVSAALQIAPALAGRAQGIMHAQQARGLSVTGLRGRVRALVPMAGPLILGALTDVGDRAVAMETRGFGTTRHCTYLTEVPDSTAQRAARAAMELCALTAVVANVLGVLR